MMRRDLLRLRNAVVPLVEVCRRLEHAEVMALDAAMTLSVGVALWAVYGFLRSDVVIIIANSISLALVMCILYFKLREHHAPA
jgi:MtN3 and saliva related transmembrane protein